MGIVRIISPADAGCTAGDFLKRKMKLSAAQISSLKFRENGICVNGKRVRVTEILREGDRMELQMEDKTCSLGHLIPVERPLKILYEDGDMVCVWKEAGTVLHPAHGHYNDTLINYLQAYFMGKGEQVQMRSIGRLDRDTSGIVVFAKNKIAAARLWEQRQSGVFRKEYVALCEGEFPTEAYEREQTINAPVGKVPGQKNKMCAAVPSAAPSSADALHCAVTHYRAVSKGHSDFAVAMRIFSDKCIPHEKEIQYSGGCAVGPGQTTLVRLHLETGRTHQIRVHMAYIGHPLVGDAVYGHGTAGQTYAKLCAWRAQLVQPFTGEKIFLHPLSGI